MCAGLAPPRADLLDELRDPPGRGQPHAFAVPGAEAEVSVPLGVRHQVAQQGDVVAAVVLDLLDAALLPPAQALQAVGALADAEGLLAEVAEGQAESQALVDGVEHVEGGKRLQIAVGVAAQHLVVEALHVEAHDQIGFGQALDQGGHVGPR